MLNRSDNFASDNHTCANLMCFSPRHAPFVDFVDRDSDVVGNDYQSNTVTATIAFNF